jgi:hypothetical protein
MKRSHFSPFLAMVVALLVSAIPRTAEAETVRHLLFDDVDKTWHCVGSPVNCDFDMT